MGFAQQPLSVALDDDHCITDICASMNIRNYTLCALIHFHPFPCSTDSAPTSYQDMLDLGDISDFEDVMTTSSDKDIPALEDVFGL